MQMKLHQPSKSGRFGFTLVELLVVIAIIALLIAILLPVLGKVKRQAQAVACASGEKQIFMAMTMFAGEHKGHLPRPYLVTTPPEMSSDLRLVAVCAWLQQVDMASGHIDLDDGKSALWPYMKGKETRRKVFLCPGDEGEMLAGHPVNPLFPRNVSYSLNNHILRDVDGVPSLGIVMAKVHDSASRILIYEEFAPNDSWCIMGYSSDDVPSGRHGTNMRDSYRSQPNTSIYKNNGKGNYCFFDGHVEALTPADLLPPSQGGKNGSERYHFPLVAGDPVVW
jgi:prepilin-type N-terminal cleavage/methylation domain-containing protein/prepilin-type processing-associated H-X9-DG protein